MSQWCQDIREWEFWRGGELSLLKKIAHEILHFRWDEHNSNKIIALQYPGLGMKT